MKTFLLQIPAIYTSENPLLGVAKNNYVKSCHRDPQSIEAVFAVSKRVFSARELDSWSWYRKAVRLDEGKA
jgi:hypothetical protein